MTYDARSNKPGRRDLPAALACALSLLAGGPQAATVLDIDFSEKPLLTPDPTIKGVAFSAGDPALFEDTFIDDFLNPTDPYLVSGIEGSGAVDLPGLSSTAFVSVVLPSTQGGTGKTTKISLDAGFVAPLPTGETIRVDALLGGIVQGTAQITTALSNLEGLTLDLDAVGFDTLFIYVPSDFGSVFRIDNLLVDVTAIVIPIPPGPDPVPPGPDCAAAKNTSAVAGDTCLDGSVLTFDGPGLTVAGDVELKRGGGIVEAGQYDGTVSGAIFGAGGLTKTGDGTLFLTGVNTYSGQTLIQAGALAVDGSLVSRVNVEPGGTLRGTGTIGGLTRVAGRLAPGWSPGTLTFTAPVIMASSGTLQIDIDGPATGTGAGSYSQVAVTGVGNRFVAAGALEPRLRGISGSATNTFVPRIGQTFTVVSAEGGIVGTFDALAQPTQGLPTGTRFDALYGANALQLALTPADYSQLPNLALSGNAQSAGSALNAARPAAYERKNALFSSLAVLDEPSLATVLTQLGGEIQADTISASFNAHRLARQTLMGRLNDLRLGRATVPVTGVDHGTDPNQSLWIQGNGGWIDTDGDDNASGYDERLYGLMAGMDLPVASNLRLGGAIGSTADDVDASWLGKSDIDTVQLIGYGLWRQDAYFANFALGYGWDSYETDRVVELQPASVLSSDADGWSAFLDVEGGLQIDRNGYAIEPTVGVRADLLYRQRFTETGGLGALTVDSGSYEAVQTSIGARVSRSFELGNDQTLIPQLRAYWLHDFGDAIASSADVSLAGQGFAVNAPDAGRDALALGLGVRMETGKTLALFLDYDFSYRSNQTGQEVIGGVLFRW